MFFLSLWLYTHIMKVPHRRPQLGTHHLLIKSCSFFVFIYLHIIAFILECKLESRKLWALGFFSLIPYLPEEPEVMHLSIWGLVTPKKTIIFSSLLCSLKSCVWSLSHWPGEPRGCSAPEISFLAEFGACRAALAGPCCYVLPCSGKGEERQMPSPFHPQVIECWSLRRGKSFLYSFPDLVQGEQISMLPWLF